MKKESNNLAYNRSVHYKINIINKNWKWDVIGLFNGVPSFVVLSISAFLIKNYSAVWVIGLPMSIALVFFSFYLNSTLHINKDGLIFYKRNRLLKRIGYSEIKKIVLKYEQPGGYNAIKVEIFLETEAQPLNFYISRYLFYSTEKMFRRIFDIIENIPNLGDKIYSVISC